MATIGEINNETRRLTLCLSVVYSNLFPAINILIDIIILILLHFHNIINIYIILYIIYTLYIIYNL